LFCEIFTAKLLEKFSQKNPFTQRIFSKISGIQFYGCLQCRMQASAFSPLYDDDDAAAAAAAAAATAVSFSWCSSLFPQAPIVTDILNPRDREEVRETTHILLISSGVVTSRFTEFGAEFRSPITSYSPG
jgi:hypothetical protein